MLRGKTFLLLLLAAGCGLVASVAVLAYLNQAQAHANQVTQQLPTRPVVVAASDLPPAELLHTAQLKVMDWPENLIPVGATGDIAQVEGRITRTPLVAGQPVLAGQLAPEGTTGGLPALIPVGLRAVTLRVNETVGVAGFIRPGNRVDVVLTVETQNPTKIVTKTILQYLQVAAVGQSLEEEPEETKLVRSVTLLLTPEEAEALALGMDQGRIVLALRNDTDPEQRLAAGLDLNSLVPQLHPEPDLTDLTFPEPQEFPEPVAQTITEPVAVAAAPPQTQVTVFRGREREELFFPK